MEADTKVVTMAAVEPESTEETETPTETVEDTTIDKTEE